MVFFQLMNSNRNNAYNILADADVCTLFILIVYDMSLVFSVSVLVEICMLCFFFFWQHVLLYSLHSFASISLYILVDCTDMVAWMYHMNRMHILQYICLEIDSIWELLGFGFCPVHCMQYVCQLLLFHIHKAVIFFSHRIQWVILFITSITMVANKIYTYKFGKIGAMKTTKSKPIAKNLAG